MTASAGRTVAGPRDNIAGHVQRLDWIRDRIARDERVLELGCGTGYMITLPLRLEGYDVRGIDLDATSVDYGRGLLEAAGLDADALQVRDLREDPGGYDAIIASEVLEHLYDDELEGMLELIHEKLRPGGRLLVTVPNGYGWFELEAALWFRTGFDGMFRRPRLNRLLSGFHHVVSRGYVDVEHPSTLANSPHRQRFTARAIRRRLADSGYEIVSWRGSVLLAGPFSHLLFTGVEPAMRLNRRLGRRAGPIAAGFYVEARRP